MSAKKTLVFAVAVTLVAAIGLWLLPSFDEETHTEVVNPAQEIAAKSAPSLKHIVLILTIVPPLGLFAVAMAWLLIKSFYEDEPKRQTNPVAPLDRPLSPIGIKAVASDPRHLRPRKPQNHWVRRLMMRRYRLPKSLR